MSWSGCIVVLSVVCALAVFIQGFLPNKPRVTGYASEKCCNSPKFNKTILMVVDALRTDFVTVRRDNWPYLQQLINQGQARVYNARVHPPTVTLPRIKALISGDIPGFIDVVMNFDSAELSGDSLLYQLRSHDQSAVFYGDDTWLKLFPQFFLRSEGTTSFFVSDYTEVDDNVTRHILPEMDREDWCLMILHYLGLDHIGHLIGPSSDLIAPKLREMDDIVKLLHTSFLEKNKKDYLIILCGDHGMADQGGHGGVTTHEVTTPMVFISHALVNKSDELEQIYQIDLVPTLAALLNLPIPQSSLGVMSTSVLEPLLSHSNTLNALAANCRQLLHLLHSGASHSHYAQIYSKYELLIGQHHVYNNSPHDESRYIKLSTSYHQLLLDVRQHLASHLVSYDVTAMIFGFILLVLAGCSLLSQELSSPAVLTVGAMVVSISALYTHCTGSLPSTVLCSNSLGTVATALATFLAIVSISSLVQRLTTAVNMSWLDSLPLLHSLSLLSSSFIEEQHQTVYFFSTTLLLVVLFSLLCAGDSTRISSVLLTLVCMTLARKWNQTGDKWAHLTDIADELNAAGYRNIKLALAAAALFVVAMGTASHRSSAVHKLIVYSSAVATFLYSLQECGYSSLSHRGYYEANWVYGSCLAMLLSAIYSWSAVDSLYKLRTSLLLLNCLLHRIVNLPLIALITVMEYLLVSVPLSPSFTVYLYYWLGHTSYFNQGNSNSLSTIDISAGYKGLSSYNPIFTALLMLVNTYSGPLFWTCSLYLRLAYSHDRLRMKSAGRLYVKMKVLDMIVLQFLIILERYHLFVWTVFAPKLIYEVVSLCLYLTLYLLAG